MINDKDFDGIPDEVDSAFNTPEEVLEMKGIPSPLHKKIEEQQLQRIWQANIPCMVKQKDDVYEIIYEEEYENRINAALNPPKVYRRRR